MLQDSLVNASLALSPSGLVHLNKFYSQEKVTAEFIQKIEPLFSQSSAHGLLYLGLKEMVAKKIAQLKKKGEKVSPVVITGRTIAKTFWGKAWCKHLESYSDYENRLPRGRSYVRNGAVFDLVIKNGEVNAQVQGTRLYKVTIGVHSCISAQWRALVKQCVGKIDSVIELLQGTSSAHVMEIMTDKNTGLFPSPHEITFSCTCPDDAYMCKHVAAVLYGVGARLDETPQDLFVLRQVDYAELVAATDFSSVFNKQDSDPKLDDLSSLFGIEFEEKKTTKTKPKQKPKFKPKSKK